MTVDKAEGRSRVTLRKNAERQVSESAQPLKSIPRDNILELIHELEVHQVELELQNEDLRRSQSDLEGLRKKYFDLYDLAPIGYVTLDQKGLIREINLTGAALSARKDDASMADVLRVLSHSPRAMVFIGSTGAFLSSASLKSVNSS